MRATERLTLSYLPAFTTLSVCLFVASGCGGGSGSRESARDSAGIALVESSQPLDAGSPRMILDPIPVFDVGGVDPHHEFGDRDLAVVLPDRRVVLGVGGTELRWFDEFGR